MPWNGLARSAPEGDDGGERDRRGVVAGELVVAGGDAADVLQMAKHGLNTPTLAVAPPVVTDLPLAGAGAGHHRRDALVPQVGAQPVRIVAPVRGRAVDASGCGVQRLGRRRDV